MIKRNYLVGLGIGLVLVIVLTILMGRYARENTLLEHREKTTNLAHREAMALESELQKFSLLPFVLAETQYVHSALNEPAEADVKTLNEKLSSLVSMTGVDYIYVIDLLGNTIASSNYLGEKSFIGRSFEYRPYFKQAMESGSAVHFAKGELTGKGGLFLSRRIEMGSHVLGVIVVKVEFGKITQRWQQDNVITLIANQDGIILFASDGSMDFSLLKPLGDNRQQQIMRSNQFGTEPLIASWLAFDEQYRGFDQSGNMLQAGVWPIADLDWQLLRVEHVGPALRNAQIRTLTIILSGGMLLAIFGIYLSWRITRDRERVLATEFLKNEVAKRTKALVISNEQLRTESTKREEINVRFRRAREELAQANRLGSIGAITASVAHEINQPVAAIKTFAQNAKKLVDRKDEIRTLQNLNSIVELTGKISAITTELRRYARRDNQVIEKISLHKVLEGVELLVGDRIRCACVDFQIIGNRIDELTLQADRVRVEQILVNLIQNSLEALDGQDAPKLQLRVEEQDKFLAITLDDNGIGIDEETLAEIFTPFFTNKSTGLGIGLGIARDISIEFGGSLENLPSQLGGAAFQLRMPKL
jgi:two-component system C4-dicarboxylate transport sensor histidine kinase DctB